MKINKHEFTKYKPFYLLITYAVVLIFLILSLADILGFIQGILNLFYPLFIGLGIAFVLNIPLRKIENLLNRYGNKSKFITKHQRSISIWLTVIFTIAFLILIFSIITPQLIQSINMLINNSANYLNVIIDNLNYLIDFLNLDQFNIEIDPLTFNETINKLGLNLEQIASNLSNIFIGASSNILTNVISFGGALGNWIMGLMISLYLLASKEKFIRQSKKIIVAFCGYTTSTFIFKQFKQLNQLFNNFVSGQLLEACILGLLYFVILSIFKMPFAMLISVIIAITSIVPMFGAIIGMIFGSILILAVSPLIDILWFYIIFQVVQLFENNVIYPRVVGSSVGLPGVWVLLSIVICGALWGMFGMIIAVPITAFVYNAISQLTNYLLKKRKLYLDDALDVQKAE